MALRGRRWRKAIPSFYRPLTLAPAKAPAAGSAENGQKDAQAELAKKLQNPVADLISVPNQNNWDFGIGPADAMRYTANIQPVIPISISKDWNIITRTILPVRMKMNTTQLWSLALGWANYRPYFGNKGVYYQVVATP